MKEVVAHPDRPAVVQQVRFFPAGPGLQLYALLAPHLGKKACGWVGDHKGVPMLFAVGDGAAVALACSAPWTRRSAGFVGVSDGRQDLSAHRRMTREYDRAEGGYVALAGQIEYPADGGEFLLVLGFGLDPDAAGLATADLATENGEPGLARYLRETAEVWNVSVERWTYVTGTDLARRVGVEGYYVRLGHPGEKDGPPKGSDPHDGSDESSVSPDAWASSGSGYVRPTTRGS